MPVWVSQEFISFKVPKNSDLKLSQQNQFQQKKKF